jgi:hypothetical protein
MKQNKILILSCLFVISALLCSLSCNRDEQYQPVGTAVLQASSLLIVKYPQGIPDNYAGEDYKNLLKENYKTLYERIKPYNAVVKKKDNRFIIQVYDGNLLILTDWGCTEGRIDCWNYNNECNPDTLHIQCDN